VILLAIACAAAAGYQAVALLAVIAHLMKQDPEPSSLPGISVLKPVRGADPGFAAAIRSHAQIDYPDFELLFGVSRADDPAVREVEQLAREFPQRRIRIIHCRSDAPNAKVGKLQILAAEALHDVLVVNDADITVPPDYLRRIAGCLQRPRTCLVTSLYSAAGEGLAASWEALGIATDFAPSTLVAPFVGVREFGLGSTLAFRASDLAQAGGFAAIRDYIADDYQVGKRLSALGCRVSMARMSVTTWLGHATWGEVWRHQVRWARTIRLSRGLYYGLPVTNASLWASLAVAAGWPWIAAGLLVLRMAVGLICGAAILRDRVTARWGWLMPLRDLWGFAVWAAGAAGNTVEWQGRRMSLDHQGRIMGPPSEGHEPPAF
jgi:ceramide glucosyltransferase